MTEEWREIPGYPGYEVSDLGRVRTWRVKGGYREWVGSRPVLNESEKTRLSEPKMLKTGTHAKGYGTVSMCSADGRHRSMLVHRAVAITFLPNPQNLSDVAHNDGDPSNNARMNLRWATHRDNQMDMRKHGTMQDGEKCVTRKLSLEQVQYVREQVAKAGWQDGTQRRLARELGVTFQLISKIATNKCWRHP